MNILNLSYCRLEYLNVHFRCKKHKEQYFVTNAADVEACKLGVYNRDNRLHLDSTMGDRGSCLLIP